MIISKKKYIQAFCIVVVLLGWGRELYFVHDRTKPAVSAVDSTEISTQNDVVAEGDEPEIAKEVPQPKTTTVAPAVENDFKPHRIYSVANFKNAFPDQNDVQLLAAEKNGIKPLSTRSEIENNIDRLVCISSNPYYFVDKMRNSVPYLVPKAALLVEDIGRNFFDSLQVKGIPLHKIIVTSVLRTDEDVANLQQRNLNAAEKSCHQYATTVDICYNRYKTVEAPDGPARREVRNDSLKWVLSEVLNDMRKQNRCYVKYEVKQGCFHLTVR